MPKGKVKWFNDQKGYGFVTPEDGSKDLFVHYQEIQGDGFKTLAEGQEVEFEVVESEKGPKAVKVVKLQFFEGLYKPRGRNATGFFAVCLRSVK